MPFPGFGALTSLTGGGALQANTPTSAASDSTLGDTVIGGVSIGGGTDLESIAIAAAALAIVVWVLRR